MKLEKIVVRGPAAGRNARRARTSARPGEPMPDLIRKAVGRLSTYPERMGIAAFARDGVELSVLLDPDAVAMADLLQKLVADPEEAEATGPVRGLAEQVSGRVLQYVQLLDNGAAAAQLFADLRDTDRQASSDDKKLQDDLYGLLEQLLDPAQSELSPTERDQLQFDATEVLGLDAEEKEKRLSERAWTEGVVAEAEAQHRAVDDEERLLRTRSDLQSGRPVDPAELEQALATFAALSAEKEAPAKAARRRGISR